MTMGSFQRTVLPVHPSSCCRSLVRLARLRNNSALQIRSRGSILLPCPQKSVRGQAIGLINRVYDPLTGILPSTLEYGRQIGSQVGALEKQERETGIDTALGVFAFPGAIRLLVVHEILGPPFVPIFLAYRFQIESDGRTLQRPKEVIRSSPYRRGSVEISQFAFPRLRLGNY